MGALAGKGEVVTHENDGVAAQGASGGEHQVGHRAASIELGPCIQCGLQLIQERLADADEETLGASEGLDQIGRCHGS